MNKFALGIHTVNVAYTAGNLNSYHRQIREGIVPLLNILLRHPTWCFNLQISGYSIEFIANNYPGVLEIIKMLINKEQIELISCTFSPQIWIAYPKYDLIKSIKLNREILESYGLKPSRIFFSHENFSGEGLSLLKEWFDVAIVKDDYYYYLYDKPDNLSSLPPYFNLNEMKLMVGWGHILEGMADKLYSKKNLNAHEEILLRKNKQFLKQGYQNQKNEGKLNGLICNYKDIEWKWYHVGSSERFGKAHMRPELAAECVFDPSWHFYAEKYLIEIESQGYTISGIQAFLKSLEGKYNLISPSKKLLDGSWNMERSKGGYIWSGFNSQPHEDDMRIRNQTWKSRSRLIGLESLLNVFPKEISQRPDVLERLSRAWKAQLLAEISDSTGWYPTPHEVQYSLIKADEVFEDVAHIVYLLKLASSLDSFLIDTYSGELFDTYEDSLEDLVKIEKSDCWIDLIRIFGSEGDLILFQIGDDMQRIIADFIPNDDCCGLEIDFNIEYLLYCPALMENECINIDLVDVKPEAVYLPLPNGLICINENTFLIKHNEFLNISACVDKKAKKLIFKITNPHSYGIHWELTIFKGELKLAIDLANRINVSPIVYLV